LASLLALATVGTGGRGMAERGCGEDIARG
jgi:hypothetical protein